MAILISSPVTGSLKIQNTSASPQTSYICNAGTVTVSGNYQYPNNIFITNANQQVIFQANLTDITKISASTQSFGLQWAIDSIANLIMK